MADDLTLEAIDELDDIISAFDLAEKHGVSTEGIEDYEDLKERLRMHYRLISVGPVKDIIERYMQEASDDIQSRCNQLIKLLRDTRSIFDLPAKRLHEDDTFLHTMLKQDGISENILEDIDMHIAAMQDSECRVLVAGETSSGKSTVLNLFFNDDLLPTHIKSSTSTVTCIKFGKRNEAKICKSSGVQEIISNFDADGRHRLSDATFIQDRDRIGTHEVQEVEVSLCSPMLRTGLVLVDTPGIGESKFLEDRLLKYISENTLHGFIYVIKTDQAGGVQEDRVVSLLKMIIEQYKDRETKFGLSQFAPKSAMFICNRIDLVEEEEREQVCRNATEKLRECWPNFDEKNVHFFSASKAKEAVSVNEDYVNDSYFSVLSGIRDVYYTAMEQRTNECYSWLQQVIRRSLHFSRSMITRLGISDKELEQTSKETKEKLHILDQKSEEVIMRLRADIEITTKDIASKVQEFISNPSCKAKLTTRWVESELPPADERGVDWGWIKSHIDEAFYNRLSKLLLDWDAENMVISNQEQKISTSIKMELNLLDHELSRIETTMDGTSSMMTICPSHIDLRQYESKIPFKLASVLLGKIQKKVDEGKMANYSNSPNRVAASRASKLHRRLTSDKELLLPFVQQLLDRPYGLINVLEIQIPKLIRSNEHLLREVSGKKVQKEETRAEFKEKIKELLLRKKALAAFGGELRVRRIVSNPVSSRSGKSFDNALANGLWTKSEHGYVRSKGQDVPVTIKIYRPTARIEHTEEEITFLRSLSANDRHPTTAQFLGCLNVDSLQPCFVFKHALSSLQELIKSTTLPSDRVLTILLHVAHGLQYLHENNMVHMELTRDTITVDGKGDVCLTGMCLPRLATLPVDLGSATGGFVYIAPEVLRGKVYTPTADVYCFGLLLLEMLVLPDGAFRKQRTLDLGKFISSVDPIRMMNLDGGTVSDCDPKLREMIRRCVQVESSSRPVMSKVVSNLARICRNSSTVLPTVCRVRSQNEPEEECTRV